MGASHLSGALIETGLRNSQDTARSEGSVRDLVLWLPPNLWMAANSSGFAIVYDGTAEWHTAMAASALDFQPALGVHFSQGMFQSADTTDTQRGESARGPRINSIDLVYAVTTNVADNLELDVETIVHTTIAAPALTNRQTFTAPTGAFVKTVTADPDAPVRANLALTTPFILTSGMIGQLSMRVNGPAGTTGMRVYGAYINYDLLI